MRSFHGSFVNHGSEAERASSDAAATLVLSLDSPPVRGVKGKPPLVAFLFGVQEPFHFPRTGKRNGS